jgi:hypothetical protein
VWYLAEIVCAEPEDAGRADYQCESCDVVLRAADAGEAYRKAVAWGLAYAAEPPAALRLLGVAHLTTIGEELRDGTEVAGRFFRVPADGGTLPELVPPPEQLKAIQWERAGDVPVGDLLTPEQTEHLRRAWGQGAGP